MRYVATELRMRGRVLGFLLLCTLCCFLPGCAPSQPVTPDVEPPVGQEDPPGPTSPITGLPMGEGGSPVAVSLGNNPTARMQSGLSQADLVYEVLAEGGITRYLALFHSKPAETVGPVRSARPYLALLAKEWGAIFAHCGGDRKDLEPIKEWKVADADEFGLSHLYWRTKDRTPPDNLYTSVENLRKAVPQALPDPEGRFDFTEWDEQPLGTLTISYGHNYRVEYRYSPDDGAYKRFVLDGNKEAQQTDRDSGDPVLVSNVIIQFAKSRVTYSDGGLSIDLIGKGKAQYLSGGRFQEGSWEKESVEGPTVFSTGEGDPLKVSPGQTWIQIIPENAIVKVAP